LTHFPPPFLACTYDNEAPLVVVTKIGEKTIESYQRNYASSVIESREDFYKEMDGIYLIAEPDEYSGEPGYEDKQKKGIC
jgi:hypothetical protein